MEATSLRFAAAARALGQAARRAELQVPGYRSPPRLADVDRSLRRRADGFAMVAVRLRGRPWVAVVSDMVEGVVVANSLQGAEADRARSAMWLALEAAELLPPPPLPVPQSVAALVAPLAASSRPDPKAKPRPRAPRSRTSVDRASVCAQGSEAA